MKKANCVSALARLERAQAISASDVAMALRRPQMQAETWREVQPVDAVRREAHRVLRVHPLRAADALQLASALPAL